MYFLENENKYHRFAISVKRKIGRAVDRNYIKRRMKELFRLNQTSLTGSYDLWIIMKKPFTKKNAPEVEDLFLRALKRIQTP